MLKRFRLVMVLEVDQDTVPESRHGHDPRDWVRMIHTVLDRKHFYGPNLELVRVDEMDYGRDHRRRPVRPIFPELSIEIADNGGPTP